MEREAIDKGYDKWGEAEPSGETWCPNAWRCGDICGLLDRMRPPVVVGMRTRLNSPFGLLHNHAHCGTCSRIPLPLAKSRVAAHLDQLHDKADW